MFLNLHDQAASVFILYLIISSNFFAPLLSCKAQTLIGNSMFLRHFLGYLTMLFFVVLSNLKEPLRFNQIISLTLGLYVWFMLSTRMSHGFWIALIVVLATLYMLEVYEKHRDEDSKIVAEDIKTGKKVLLGISIATTLLGNLIYLGEKKLEYGKSFRYSTFLFGKPTCKDASPDVSWHTALKLAFS